jgi:hypothetical protein
MQTKVFGFERINLWLVEITVNNVHRRSNLLIVIIRDINCERTTIAEKKNKKDLNTTRF